MKRRALGALLLAATLGATGCGGVELTDQQTSEAAEYMAGLILKYDKNYTDTLVYPAVTEEPEETEEIVASATPEVEQDETNGAEKTGDGGSSEAASLSLNDVYGLKDFDITCSGVKTMSECVEKNDMLAVYAEKGKTLAVVSFSVKNTTNTDKKLYLIEKGISYQLTVSGESYNSELSLLSGDMNFANQKIKAGQNWKGVVIFQIPAKASLEEAQLTVSSDTKTAKVKLK